MPTPWQMEPTANLAPGNLLDRRVVCDLPGFDESIYQDVRLLAAKWCAEPSVHGGKARPKDAEFVM